MPCPGLRWRFCRNLGGDMRMVMKYAHLSPSYIAQFANSQQRQSVQNCRISHGLDHGPIWPLLPYMASCDRTSEIFHS